MSRKGILEVKAKKLEEQYKPRLDALEKRVKALETTGAPTEKRLVLPNTEEQKD